MNNANNEPVESGNPTSDARMFRRCLGQFGTGIAIITGQKDGQRAGVTVNSVASVSLDPPLVLWSISRASRSLPIFRDGGAFVINILGKNQIELARHFSSPLEDKFQGISLLSGGLGIPMLEGVVAHLVCSLEATYEGGDHMILIGRVAQVSRYREEPLLFVQGRYVVAADHPDAPNPNDASTVVGPPAESDSNLIPLLFEAHHALSAKFEDHRRAEGMGQVPARILAALDGSRALSLEAVARKTYVDPRAAEDSLADLISRGHVERQPGGEFCLTLIGRERREAIKRRWLDFQSVETAGIQPEAVEAASVVLKKLLTKGHAESLSRAREP